MSGTADLFGGIVGSANLYARVEGSSVRNAEIDLPETEVGGIIGQTATSTTVRACSFSGTINGGPQVGGIVANQSADGDVVENCHVDADLTGRGNVGGISGFTGRGKVNNCFVEGFVMLHPDSKEGSVGGLIGYLEELATNEKEVPVIIEHNLLAVDSIGFMPSSTAGDIVAHRIIGRSSADEMEWDWEHINPDGSYDKVSVGKPEKGLANNYVIDKLAIIDTTIVDNDSTTEGKTIAPDSITTEWLGAQNFLFGNNVAQPWMLTKTTFGLWFEEQIGGFYADSDEITMQVGQSAHVTFTVVGGDAEKIQLEWIESFMKCTAVPNGEDLVVTIEALGVGTAELKATYETYSLSVSITIEEVMAVEDTNVNVPSVRVQKMVRDGQVVIVRDGKAYSVLGVAL